MRLAIGLLSVLVSAAPAADAGAARVLFVGDAVGAVPFQLQRLAASLGTAVQVANSTREQCTAYAQRPGVDSGTKALLTERVWDFIVVGTYAPVPTVVKARAEYLYPAVRDIVSLKGGAKVVMYAKRANRAGIATSCPPTPKAGANGSSACFPLGELAELTDPPCATAKGWRAKVHDFDCMTYSLARGYLGAIAAGADMVAPCGLAWQAVRSSGGMAWGPGSGCTSAVDKEYEKPSPFTGDAILPLVDPAAGNLTHVELYHRANGTGRWDGRSTVAGEYLDALVLYAALFGTSPVGAAPPPLRPNSSLPSPLSASDVTGLQRLASSVVLLHPKLWGSTVPVLPANPTRDNPLLLYFEIGVAVAVVVLLVCACLRPCRADAEPHPSGGARPGLEGPLLNPKEAEDRQEEEQRYQEV